MSDPPPELTPRLIEELAERIKAGAFEEVAAELLGVPLLLYRHWLARGEGPGARGPCRDLLRAVRQARAQARLLAEMDLRRDAPKVWLLNGPGKDTTDLPGWAAPPRPREHGREAPLNPLEHPEVVALMSAVMEALLPFPDARAAVLNVLDGMALPDAK
jgi:hypothetical protein